MGAYGEDLSYIHDVGFGGFAQDAAPWLFRTLAASGVDGELVIDLGCGSGIWARALVDAGYRVLGYDLSPEMVALAEARVPEGEFRVESFLRAELPPCRAVTALGEVLGYLFDPSNADDALDAVFRRVHSALLPGGMFIFDLAGPGRAGPSGLRQSFMEGEDWVTLVTAEEDRERGTLTREITSFRRVGDLYRRAHETHRLRLHEPRETAERLRRAGFRARVLRGYGQTRFPAGWRGFLARKPGGR